MTGPTDSQLQDVFTTALEGGIGYWSQAETYFWSDESPSTFFADIVDVEDDNERWRIDITVIRTGLAALLNRPPADPYQRRAVYDLAWGEEDADYDADTADAIVQMGLFGELVYG